ncbi:hypothetical protein [Parasphingorhabdus pacifica]
MEGYAQQAGALAGQAQGLRAAVDNGKLVMDPEAAERVAKVYEEKADDLQKQRQRTHRLVAHEAFGDCEIGRAMARKFEAKAQGDAGLEKILEQMEDTLRRMAQAYRDSARDMQNADDENAQNLGRSA